MSRKTNTAVREILGAPANLQSAWEVMEGAVRSITVGKKASERRTWRFGKNVRGELAKLGYNPRQLTGEEMREFTLRCDYAERKSAERGYKFIHRSGFALGFLNAKGAKVADEANRIAGNKNERVRVRKVLAAEEANAD